ncbi:uncharacterized protein CDAR_608231 [Caerostris darwini]|uniref:Uncharacterized protein n=1 Tax=Caerostris darwini TaxID=1538125 RepID=A0AAV4R7G7_9ARAC|nr:uncharacterized protein CDAR_608231 [Caerostris darwini]
MATFYYSVFASMLIAILVHSVNAESLRDRIFGEVDEYCGFEQFRCQNNRCIPRTYYCNGRNDCGDNSDERYCSISGSKCPSEELFSCRNPNSYYKCIPKSWRCDGFADCYYREDETNCKEDRDILQPTYLRKKKSLAVNWTYELRNEDNPTRKWGSEVARIAVALYLSNSTLFASNSTLRDEIAYELSLDLLSRLALKKITDVSSTELAAYINAFLVTCIDPQKFYVQDLVSELRKRVDAQNYTNPSVLLALCNAGERIMDRDIQKLLSLFDNVHREFWTDTQALAILALTCASKQPYEAYDLEEIRELTMELKKRQYRNGTVENLKTTALVMQALLAAENEADEENFDEEKALKQILHFQMPDGSFGSIVNTYYVLPVLGRKSLVNISSSHCTTAVVDENDAIKDLMNQVGEKWRIQISLWIGNDRTVERTLALKVPANSSLYRVMEIAATVDDKYKFEYSMRNGKPFIYSISGFQDDPENELFWFLFTSKGEMKEELQPTTKSESEWNPSMVYS